MAEAEEIVPTEIPAPKSGNKILPIILVVNTLLMVGVLMFVMKKPSAPSAAGGEAKEHAAAAKGHEAPAAKGEGGEHTGEHAGEHAGDHGQHRLVAGVEREAPAGLHHQHETLVVLRQDLERGAHLVG